MAKFSLKYINEGKQAEEYKADKAKQQEKDNNESMKKALNRMGAGDKYTSKYPGKVPQHEKGVTGSDMIRTYRTASIAGKDLNRRNKDSFKGNKMDKPGEFTSYMDGINRHLRRHPKNESTILNTVNVTIIR